MFKEAKELLLWMGLISSVYSTAAKSQTSDESFWFGINGDFKESRVLKILRQTSYSETPKDPIARWIKEELLVKNNLLLTRDVWISSSRDNFLLMVRLIPALDKAANEIDQTVTFLVIEAVKNQHKRDLFNRLTNVRLVSMSYLKYITHFHTLLKKEGWTIYYPPEFRYKQYHSDCKHHNHKHHRTHKTRGDHGHRTGYDQDESEGRYCNK